MMSRSARNHTANQVIASEPKFDEAKLLSTRFGRYHLLRRVGRGGSAEVYEAYDPELTRKVAIKVLHDEHSPTSDSFAADATNPANTLAHAEQLRLIREAKVLARLNHPNVVPIYDVGLVDGHTPFLAMEFIGGQTLRFHLYEHKLQWREILGLLLQAGEGLAAAHAAGILHRDFKPDNVMVNRSGRVIVLDFGLSRTTTSERHLSGSSPGKDPTGCVEGHSVAFDTVAHHDLTHFGAVLGTPAYMAPENQRGESPTVQSDLFAFGCVCYEALVGKRPFVGELGPSRLQAITRGKLFWPRHFPHWLARVIGQSLAFDPTQRGGGVGEMLVRLRAGLMRERRFKKVSYWFVTALIPTLLGVIWAFVPKPPVDPDCRDPARLIDEVWNASARQKLVEGFAATNLNFADALAMKSVHALNEWHGQWIGAAAQLCPETRAAIRLQPFDSSLREQSRGCLMESRAEVEAMLSTWEHASVDQVIGSPQALNSLSKPELCTHVDELRARAPLPVDVQKRSAVLEQLALIRRARTNFSQANYLGATQVLSVVERQQERSFDILVSAEAMHVRADIASVDAGNGIKSTPVLLKSLLYNIAANRSEAVSEALHGLWFARVYFGNARSESSEHLRHLDAQVERAGRPATAVAKIARARGIWEGMNGNHRIALDHFSAAVSANFKAFGEASSETLWALDDLAYTAWLIGYSDLAHSLREKNVLVTESFYPVGHPFRIRPRFMIAIGYYFSGRLQESLNDLIATWNESVAANVPETSYVEFMSTMFDGLHARGQLLEALQHVLFAIEAEKRIQRRLLLVDPWSESFLSTALVSRGEIAQACELAQKSSDKVQLEPFVHPQALIRSLLVQAQCALATENFSAVENYLAQATTVLQTPTEEGHLLQAVIADIRGALALAQDDGIRAANHFEEALAASAAHYGAHQSSHFHRQLAEALLIAGDLDLALHHALYAFAQEKSVEDLLPHLLVPFHETLARVALAQRRYGDALVELELAQLAFDSVQVLDNRRASLFFIEAQIGWALARTDFAKADARALANRALDAYRDWDAGAQSKIAAIERWLRRH